MERKDNLVIVITGGVKGLGKFLAERLSGDGHIVNIIDIVKNEKADGQRFNYYRGDVSSKEDVESIFRDIYEKYGRIDVLINNAAREYFSLLKDAIAEDIRKTLDVNLGGVYISTKEALKYMHKTAFGRIINISSNSAFRGYRGGSIYCSTKAAVNIFTESISKELSDNITINAICPSQIDLKGWKKEDRPYKENRLIRPQAIFEIINKIIYSNINGEIIPIISPKTFLAHLLYQAKRTLKWVKYLIWRYFHV